LSSIQRLPYAHLSDGFFNGLIRKMFVMRASGMVQNELTLSHAARTGMKCPCYEAAPDESG